MRMCSQLYNRRDQRENLQQYLPISANRADGTRPSREDPLGWDQVVRSRGLGVGRDNRSGASQGRTAYDTRVGRGQGGVGCDLLWEGGGSDALRSQGLQRRDGAYYPDAAGKRQDHYQLSTPQQQNIGFLQLLVGDLALQKGSSDDLGVVREILNLSSRKLHQITLHWVSQVQIESLERWSKDQPGCLYYLQVWRLLFLVPGAVEGQPRLRQQWLQILLKKGRKQSLGLPILTLHQKW